MIGRVSYNSRTRTRSYWFLGPLTFVVGTSLVSASVQVDLATYRAGLTVWGQEASLLGYAVATGDLNGDGALDLAIAEPWTLDLSRVCLYLGPVALPAEIDRATTVPATCVEPEGPAPRPTNSRSAAATAEAHALGPAR